MFCHPHCYLPLLPVVVQCFYAFSPLFVKNKNILKCLFHKRIEQFTVTLFTELSIENEKKCTIVFVLSDGLIFTLS